MNTSLILTAEQKTAYNVINSLQESIESGTLSTAEIAHFKEMTKKQKRNLVSEIYFKDKKKKSFYVCKDGRVKSYNPQFIAPNEDLLIDKLYNYYFSNTLTSTFEEWLLYRKNTKIVSNKTIEEYLGLWNRLIADSDLAKMQIVNIRTKHILRLFHAWTGNSLITRKDFNNRKSLLNGIFNYAVSNELIEVNPLASIACRDFKFKVPAPVKKAYTIQERNTLLNYLGTLDADAYILAIMLAFHGIFRIGEIKALTWDSGNQIIIQHQLVEERILQDDLTLSHPYRMLKDPKGNPYYSIRIEELSEEGVNILKKMKTLNPCGQFLFMHEGRPLTTDSFNRRLKKYCSEVGIPYLSSHKIRFTGASMLYNAGVKPIDIQPLLGHSTLAMTQHYIGQPVEERNASEMARILA